LRSIAISSEPLKLAAVRSSEQPPKRNSGRLQPDAEPASGDNQDNLTYKLTQSLYARLWAFSMHADSDGRRRDQMESIMLTQRQDIRRRLDGSIEIDRQKRPDGAACIHDELV
jgi:hypothetical protein